MDITASVYEAQRIIHDEQTALAHVVERFKNESIAGHISLTKGERSKLSELASNLL